TVNEGQPATFTASADGTPPYSLQWLSNGVPVAGGTNFSLTTPPLSAFASSANYSVVVSNEFSSAASTNGRLTVIPRTRPPAMVQGQNIGTTNVSASYSEPVQAASATNKANYSLSGAVSISAAVMGTDNRTVTLTVSPLVIGSNYTITVNNVQDRAAT